MAFRFRGSVLESYPHLRVGRRHGSRSGGRAVMVVGEAEVALAGQHALVGVLQQVLAGAEEVRRVGGGEGVAQRRVVTGVVGGHLGVHPAAHVQPAARRGAVNVPPAAGVPRLHRAGVSGRRHPAERPRLVGVSRVHRA